VGLLPGWPLRLARLCRGDRPIVAPASLESLPWYGRETVPQCRLLRSPAGVLACRALNGYVSNMILRIFRISVGCLLIVLGLAGLVLPVLQGGLLLALGILVLSVDVPIFRRFICWLEARFPSIRGPLNRVRERLAKRGGAFPPCPPPDE